MKIRTVLILIGMSLIAALIVLNWNVIMIPTSLYFGIATIHAPLGIMMLAILMTITTLFLALFLYTKTAWLSKDRNHSDKIQAGKDFSGNTENLQIAELQMYLRTELNQQSELFTNSMESLMLRLQQMENKIRESVTL